MLDGDDTYPLDCARGMVDRVLGHGADMVVGDRLSSTYFTENKRPSKIQKAADHMPKIAKPLGRKKKPLQPHALFSPAARPAKYLQREPLYVMSTSRERGT